MTNLAGLSKLEIKELTFRQQAEDLGLDYSVVSGFSPAERSIIKEIHDGLSSPKASTQAVALQKLNIITGKENSIPAGMEQLGRFKQAVSFLHIKTSETLYTQEEREKVIQQAELSRQAMDDIHPYDLKESEFISAEQIRSAVLAHEKTLSDRSTAKDIASGAANYRTTENKKVKIGRVDSTRKRNETQLCPEPHKKNFTSADLAAEFIKLKHPDDKRIRPYNCRCGGIHIGHKR